MEPALPQRLHCSLKYVRGGLHCSLKYVRGGLHCSLKYVRGGLHCSLKYVRGSLHRSLKYVRGGGGERGDTYDLGGSGGDFRHTKFVTIAIEKHIIYEQLYV